MSEQFPAVASSLLIHGTVVSHTSIVGSERPNLHPSIWKFAEELSPEQRMPFTARCAESALVSDQLWAIDSARNDGRTTTLREAAPHFEGSVLISKMVRDQGHPDHGRTTEPCGFCTLLLQELGVRVML
ncbi:YwqJ-related putative deaminase [Streptomyces sp. NPDC047117]|uniref:YwqJ-related putative deaminase n=1 Tax=unclassified Streptomyces TaxID=2593676 RepID=UPI0033E93798